MRFDAFLSYSQMDRKFATQLQSALEAAFLSYRKLQLFRDEDDLGATPNLTGTLRGALEDSASLILLCTPQSVRRPKWMELEFRHYWENSKGDVLILVISELGSEPDQIWICSDEKQSLDKLPAECRLLIPETVRNILDKIGASPSGREIRVLHGSPQRPIRTAALVHQFLCQSRRSSFIARYVLMRTGVWLRRIFLALLAIVIPGLLILAVSAMSGPYGGEYWSQLLELQNTWTANELVSVPAAYGGQRLEAELSALGLSIPDNQLRFYSPVDGVSPPPELTELISEIVACHQEHGGSDCLPGVCRSEAAKRLQEGLSNPDLTSEFLTCVKALQ